MRKIRIGVYYNNGGHQITGEVLKNPSINGEIVACCHVPEAEQIPGVRVYETLEEMIKDPEVELISLCSPVRKLQAKEAIQVLQGGKHVLSEKPCAMTEEELDEILKVSGETGKAFHEMTGSVFVQPYWAMRELVLSGKLGEIVQVYAQKSYPSKFNTRPQDEEVDGGNLLQVGVHAIRFIEHITGLQVKELKALETQVGNPDPKGNLHTAVSYMGRLENGGLLSALSNYMNFPEAFGKYGNECFRVFGTEGYAEIMDGGRKSRVILNQKDLGELDTSKVPKSYLSCYLDSLLGISPMPLSQEQELHPLRMLLRARKELPEQGSSPDIR